MKVFRQSARKSLCQAYVASMSQLWGRLLPSVALGIVSAIGLSLVPPKAQALEAVQLTYGELESELIPLADLETFAFSGIPSQDIQILLDILRIEERTAQEFLTREIPLDMQSIRETSETFIGATFWRLVGTAISMTDTTGLAWEHLRDALLDAAADDRVTLLEVLQNVETGLLVIDTQRLSALSSLLRQDTDKIQPFF